MFDGRVHADGQSPRSLVLGMTDLTGPLPEPPGRGETLLTTDELAERLRVTAGAVRQMHRRGTGPPSVKAGRRRLYPQHLYEHWLRDRGE